MRILLGDHEPATRSMAACIVEKFGPNDAEYVKKAISIALGDVADISTAADNRHGDDDDHDHHDA